MMLTAWAPYAAYMRATDDQSTAYISWQPL